MAKVDIDLVKHILQRNEFETRQVAAIIEEIEKELQIQKEENPPTPQVKKQFCILISDPEGKLPEADFTGWVLQIPEEDSPATVEERLFRSAYEFNATPKGRRMPVKSVGEACETVPARITKEQQIWIKTKEPVFMLRTTNQIPFDKLDKAMNDGL
ncbi:MAG: hypothetical protein JJU20_13415 [Opitutales bacterium]|nr:hypothetical protein [Opitutales bacterium]